MKTAQPAKRQSKLKTALKTGACILGAATVALPAEITAYQYLSGNDAQTEKYQIILNKLTAQKPFTGFDANDKIFFSTMSPLAYASFKFKCSGPVQIVDGIAIRKGEVDEHGRMPINSREIKYGLETTINTMLDKAKTNNDVLCTINSIKEENDTGSGFVCLVVRNRKNREIYAIVPGLDWSNPVSKIEGAVGGANAYFDNLRLGHPHDALTAMRWIEKEYGQRPNVVTVSYSGLTVGAFLASLPDDKNPTIPAYKVTAIDGPAIRGPAIHHIIEAAAQEGIKLNEQQVLTNLNSNLMQIMTEVPTTWNANGGLVTDRTFITDIQKPAVPPGNSVFVLSNDWHSILTWGPPSVGLTTDKFLKVDQTSGNRMGIALNQKDDYSKPYKASETPPNGLVVRKIDKDGKVQSGQWVSSGKTNLPGDINQLLFLGIYFVPSALIGLNLTLRGRRRYYDYKQKRTAGESPTP